MALNRRSKGLLVIILGLAPALFAQSKPPADQGLSVAPRALSFKSTAGAKPPSQTVQVSNSGGSLSFTTTVSTESGGNWLSAVPAAGTTPMALTISVDPAGLNPGGYSGKVTVTASSLPGNSSTVLVKLVAGPPASALSGLEVSPRELVFKADVGGSAAPQPVQITSTGTALTLTAEAATTSGGAWLAVSPAGATTPATLAVTATVGSLQQGVYTGSVTLSAAKAAKTPIKLPVVLIVGSSTPLPVAPPIGFSFTALDSQADGDEMMLISGTGGTNPSEKAKGGGNYTRFKMNGDVAANIALGTWTATSMNAFTPAPNGGAGGVLELEVELTPNGGGAAIPARIRIASTGTDAGVTVTITGGSRYVPSGVGTVVLQAGSASVGRDKVK